MSQCPNCGAEVAGDAAKCPSCGAIFGGTGWKPLGGPPVPEAPASTGALVAYGITKLVLAALSLAALGAAAIIAHHEHGDRWTIIDLLAMAGVILVAIRARVRWSFLVLFGSVALGLTTCVANFHWKGG
jgi:hypothetical protein